jgi:hypothetical protein
MLGAWRMISPGSGYPDKPDKSGFSIERDGDGVYTFSVKDFRALPLAILPNNSRALKTTSSFGGLRNDSADRCIRDGSDGKFTESLLAPCRSQDFNSWKIAAITGCIAGEECQAPDCCMRSNIEIG